MEKIDYLGDSYFIQIHSPPGWDPGLGLRTRNGDCIISIYQSLDKGHGSPPVEHVIKKGSFELEGVSKLTTDEFLKAIRQGIREKLPGIILE